jgi:hypothetical protein
MTNKGDSNATGKKRLAMAPAPSNKTQDIEVLLTNSGLRSFALQAQDDK